MRTYLPPPYTVRCGGMAIAMALLGCSATGLPLCGTDGIKCASFNDKTATKITCGCACSSPIGAPFSGNIPICLPPGLNPSPDVSSPDQLLMLANEPLSQYNSDLHFLCTNEMKTAVELVAHTVFDACGLGTCDCEWETTQTNDNPACHTGCGKVQCTVDNCKDVIQPDGTINLDHCNCTFAKACNDESSVFCRPPPGTADPNPNTFGVMTGFLARQTDITLSPTQSHITADISIQGNQDTETSEVSGQLHLYGDRKADGSAEYKFDLGVNPADVTLHLGGMSVPVTDIRITAGMGDFLLPVLPNGLGAIAPHDLAVHLEAIVNGKRVFLDQDNLDTLLVNVDWTNKVFMMTPFAVDTSVGTITVGLNGVISNQPPNAVASPTQTIECTSPSGAEVLLDGTASNDPDDDIVASSWFLGTSLDASFAIAKTLTTNQTVPFTPPSEETTFTLLVADSRFQMGVSQTRVTVIDTTAPEIEVGVSPSCLWAPAHKFVLFEEGDGWSGSATDVCDPNPKLKVSGITSSQPSKGGGSGNTSPDYSFGTHSFCLRSEREGTSKAPRQYTVAFAAVDASGNHGTFSTVVAVGHDQGALPCEQVPSERVVADDDPRCTGM